MSKPVPVFSGVVTTDGVVRLDARALFHRYVRTLANTPITLIVKKLTRQRTTSQNRWYWGCIVPLIAEHCGYQPYEHEALHDELVRKFLGLRPEPNPLGLRISTSDPEFTTADFAEYCDQVRIWAATDLGVVIPDPNTVEVPAAKRRVA